MVEFDGSDTETDDESPGDINESKENLRKWRKATLSREEYKQYRLEHLDNEWGEVLAYKLKDADSWVESCELAL